MSNAKEIWETLSKIDVSEHIEKKGNLSYLSWAWAWGILMSKFPNAKYTFYDDTRYEDSTVTVNCRIEIGDVIRDMWLPVMDNRNNAVKNPDARKISDAKMRCLVKAIAMLGLGHYIYAGEDLPQSESQDEFIELKKLMEDGDCFNFAFLFSALDEEYQIKFFNSFDKGVITKQKQTVREMLNNGYKEADDLAEKLKEYAIKEDQFSIRSEADGLSRNAIVYMSKKWDENIKKYIRGVLYG